MNKKSHNQLFFDFRTKIKLNDIQTKRDSPRDWDRWGQTLRVATKKCMAWSCFCVKSSVFGHRMPHFAVILGETEVTNVGALKFQVSV